MHACADFKNVKKNIIKWVKSSSRNQKTKKKHDFCSQDFLKPFLCNLMSSFRELISQWWSYKVNKSVCLSNQA